MKINFNNYRVPALIIIITLLWTASGKMLSLVWEYGLLQGVAPTTIVIFFLYCYDRWLWRLPFFNWLVTIPDLNGEYKGVVEYNLAGQDKSKGCALEITQTASHIRVMGRFSSEGENDTRSESKMAFLVSDNVYNHTLCIYYHNKGSEKAGDTLEQHDGMNVLEIRRNKQGITLEGGYFTNRSPQTRGCIKVSQSKGV